MSVFHSQTLLHCSMLTSCLLENAVVRDIALACVTSRVNYCVDGYV